jgi:hypothetical protein
VKTNKRIKDKKGKKRGREDLFLCPVKIEALPTL